MPFSPLGGGSAPDPPQLGGSSLPGGGRFRARKRSSLRQRIPWLPFILPLLVFLALTALEGPLAGAYPMVYALKTALVTLVLWRVRPFLPELKYSPRGWGTALLAGAVLAPAWVLLDHITPHLSFLGTRSGYDPFHSLLSPLTRAVFLLVRFWGLIVVAPLVEETCYRGFLLRWLSDPNGWQKLPVWTFGRGALWGTALLMALSHPEWVSAGVFALAMAWLLVRTRNLSACVAAHGVTNALLGLYVVLSHDWRYW